MVFWGLRFRFGIRAGFSVCFPVQFLAMMIAVDSLLAWAAAHLFEEPMANVASVWLFEVSDLDEKIFICFSGSFVDSVVSLCKL